MHVLHSKYCIKDVPSFQDCVSHYTCIDGPNKLQPAVTHLMVEYTRQQSTRTYTLNGQSYSEPLLNITHVTSYRLLRINRTNETVLSHFYDFVHKRTSILDCVYPCKDGPNKLQYAVTQLLDGMYYLPITYTLNVQSNSKPLQNVTHVTSFRLPHTQD